MKSAKLQIYGAQLLERGSNFGKAFSGTKKAKKSPLTYGRALGVTASSELSILRDKHEFVQMLRGLGYKAPAEFLLKKNEVIDESDLSVFFSSFESQRLLIKPRYGSQGRGIFRFGKASLASLAAKRFTFLR